MGLSYNTFFCGLQVLKDKLGLAMHTLKRPV
jgi:hypothetical protein